MLAEGERREKHEHRPPLQGTLSENGKHATGGSLAGGSRVSVRLHLHLGQSFLCVCVTFSNH
jgi:hypothetical protein